MKASPVWMSNGHVGDPRPFCAHRLQRTSFWWRGKHSASHPLTYFQCTKVRCVSVMKVSRMWGKILSLKERGHVFNLNAHCQKHFYWMLNLEVFSTECCRHQYVNCNSRKYDWRIFCYQSKIKALVSGWMREMQEVILLLFCTPAKRVLTWDCGRTPRNFSKSLEINSQEVPVLKVCAMCDPKSAICSVDHISPPPPLPCFPGI